jgi:predicted amidohydrolase YtcJ
MVGGSDCPVEPLAPLSGIAAAVNRPGREEVLGIEDAIALYTRNAAYASFDENVKGTICPGKYADIVVLEKDLRKVPPSRIAETKILMTIVGGRIVYSSAAFLRVLKEKGKAAH